MDGVSSNARPKTGRGLPALWDAYCVSREPPYVLSPRGHRLCGLGRRDDRNHVELDDVAPCRQPLIEQGAIVALHDLVAVLVIRGHPTRDVDQALGRETP